MGDKKRQRRIFINDVEKYSSNNIAEFLSACRDEEASEDGEPEAASAPGGRDAAFQVVGTVSAAPGEERKPAEFLYQQHTGLSREELLPLLLDCDVVIYNISEEASQQLIEEATWALTALHTEMENFKSRKTFILVSSVMTWALTEPQNPDDPDAVLTEEEFRRRRPHPSFRHHYNLEKIVLRLARGKKSKLNGYVIASGLQYGRGENLFHYFFQVSWLMEFTKIPVLGHGKNHLPMIHVADLAGVVQNVIQVKPKSKYIVAVDDSKNTAEEVVMMISELLGPGETVNVSEDKPLALASFKPGEADCLTADLRLDPFILKDAFKLQWVSEAGMVGNMEKIIEEYKHARQLQPVKICLLGPPAVGKSTVAQELCFCYRIHLVSIRSVIGHKIMQLVSGAKRAFTKPQEEMCRPLVNNIVAGTDSMHVTKEEAAAAQKQLDNIKRSERENNGQIAEQLLIEMFVETLKSRKCQNHGFVLDGFPPTYREAQLLFSETDKDSAELDSVARTPAYNKAITPDHVFALEATEDFLIRRVQRLPENMAERMGYTQSKFLPRLATYQQTSNSEASPLIYFDELEIHPEHIEVTTDDLTYRDALRKIERIVGAPTTYGLPPERQRVTSATIDALTVSRVTPEAVERRRRAQGELADMAAQFVGWKRSLAEVKRQEDELLEAHALPLRSYLMRHVMPSLSAAMLDCCAAKPDDPIDFLAEHLLQNNLEAGGKPA